MAALAADCPRKGRLRMEGWLYHLLCFAADASADGAWPLARAALGALAAVLAAGVPLPDQLMRTHALPLLRQLAAQRPQQAAAAARGADLRPAVAGVVAALAVGPSGPALPEGEREFWTDLLLTWLIEPGAQQRQQPGQASGQQAAASSSGADLPAAVTAALEALASPPGAEGLHVAHAWLAEMLVHLSHEVRPYHSVRASPQKKRRLEGGGGGGGPEDESGGGRWLGSWPGWLPGGWGAGSGAAEPAAAPAAPPIPGPVAEGAEDASAAAAAADGGQAAALSEAEAPRIAEEASHALAGAAGAPADSSWGGSAARWASYLWPSTWLGGGAAEGGGAGAAAEGSARASDSELSLFINAAPIGPVYARAVAADLLEASGRVGECACGCGGQWLSCRGHLPSVCERGTRWLFPHRGGASETVETAAAGRGP